MIAPENPPLLDRVDHAAAPSPCGVEVRAVGAQLASVTFECRAFGRRHRQRVAARAALLEDQLGAAGGSSMSCARRDRPPRVDAPLGASRPCCGAPRDGPRGCGDAERRRTTLGTASSWTSVPAAMTTAATEPAPGRLLPRPRAAPMTRRPCRRSTRPLTEPDRFREVFGHFATGVAVVTAPPPTDRRDDDERGRARCRSTRCCARVLRQRVAHAAAGPGDRPLRGQRAARRPGTLSRRVRLQGPREREVHRGPTHRDRARRPGARGGAGVVGLRPPRAARPAATTRSSSARWRRWTTARAGRWSGTAARTRACRRGRCRRGAT